MKRNIRYSVLIIVCLFLFTGCNKKIENTVNTNDETKKLEKVDIKVKVYINNNEYLLNLEDNVTVNDFINLLPLDITMNELNGNEKYFYLNEKLKSNPINPKHINKGDVMLYGNNCLVIFYKSFDTSYSYTKIGHIDNLSDLGNGNVKVKIEK